MPIRPKYLFGFLVLAVILLWLLYPRIIQSELAKWLIPDKVWVNRGVIGDSFGALNTLFSGLALSGLAATIYIQFAQLRRLERKEDDNERMLKFQATALRLTALLNYYNDELARVEHLLEQYKALANSGKPDKELESELWARHQKLRTSRDDIVAQLATEE